jgi:predicted dehydrogenase
MSRAQLPIGVIGLGRMGQVHARILARQIQGAQLLAVADLDSARARGFAESFGVPYWYDNPDDLLAHADLEAVVVSTPSDTHVSVVTAAARAGLAVLCEKPLALDLEGTDRAIAAAELAGVRLQVGFMRRTQPEYLRLKRAIREGRLGRPVLFRATQRDPDAPPASFCDPAVSGGILVDMGIHEFDLARWLLEDEVRAVQAFGTASVFPELEAVGDFDNATVNLAFQGGAVGSVDLSRNARYGEDIRTEVIGSKDGVFVGELPSRSKSSTDAQETTDRCYRPQLQTFVNAIRKDGELAASGADSRAALLIALAARQSVETGEVVRLGS